MRGFSPALAVFLLTVGCASDDSPAEGLPPGADAGTAVDAGAPGPQPPVEASTRPDPNAPPPTLHGKKLYSVRFDSRAGDQPFACGTRVTLGTRSTLAEPVDMRFYVHDVSLVRASGERVPLELHQDERYQRENVALLDFADDTGKCLTGDAEIRNVVHGYAPEHADYTALAFKVGVPADKNHLNAAEAPAPFNASGLWWSWNLGFKYMRVDVTSDVQPIWYFHGGGGDCGGTVQTGFACAAAQIAKIELPDYDPERSLVVFDATRFYATSDLTVGDDTPGCMSFKGDAQCAPLYAALGVIPFDDRTPGPPQTAFVLKTGAALVGSKGGATTDRKASDPNAWPDPGFQRPAALDVDNVSKAGDTRSHPPADPRHGANCMRCHQEQGPGVGKFTAAGTLLDASGKPGAGVKVEVFSADTVGFAQFENVVSKAVLDVDAHGNFFTTAPLDLEAAAVSARILGADGQPIMTMPFVQQTAACNNCHTGGMRLTLPAR